MDRNWPGVLKIAGLYAGAIFIFLTALNWFSRISIDRALLAHFDALMVLPIISLAYVAFEEILPEMSDATDSVIAGTAGLCLIIAGFKFFHPRMPLYLLGILLLGSGVLIIIAIVMKAVGPISSVVTWLACASVFLLTISAPQATIRFVQKSIQWFLGVWGIQVIII